MPAPQSVRRLVERFKAAEADGSAKRLNETQIRREFIDPLFDALGWDMSNIGGANERDKDVVHEYSLQDPAGHMAPDYCFQVAGERAFFVEAKRPAVNIGTALSPAFQLRSYAWSAQLPLSVLTDFRNFSVYDCREIPSKLNTVDYARRFHWTYSEYSDKWDDIAGLFSKRAIVAGSIDDWARSTRPPKGSSPPDVAFLQLIETWRAELAKSFATRNPNLTAEELNAVVQTTIDRILFLRIAEDRGLEPYKQLYEARGGLTYSNLCRLFVQADGKYNSGLFHFSVEPGRANPDNVTLGLQTDNMPFKEIIDRLYYPNSPYQFAILPVELLGHVYERFLGKIIMVDPRSRKAWVEEKPEVRKAGGIYYTPESVVDYMVENSLGRWLVGKSIRQADRLKIVDPACGSGTFLIRCYQYLLDWYLAQYKNDPEKFKNRIRTGLKNTVLLTAEERKKILLRSIFGVDKDQQAVETTKLSLLLKVLEGETAETIRQQLAFLKERALPDLDQNIKCGNSLIESDFFATRNLSQVSDEELRAIKPFDWKADLLDNIKAAGFDVVIGNPPYIFTREQIPTYEREYFVKKYNTSFDKHNTFALFMELMSRLLAPSGIGSFIVPNSWLTIASLEKLRTLIVPRLMFVADLNYIVFSGVAMEPCIFGMSSQGRNDEVEVLRAYSKRELETAPFERVGRSAFQGPGHRIAFQRGGSLVKIVDRVLGDSDRVGRAFDVRSGLQAYEKGKGSPPQTAEDVANHVFDRQKKIDRHSIRYLGGVDVGRYFIAWGGLWMQYGSWLSQPRTIDIFTRPRVLIREITNKFPHSINAAFVDEQYLNNKSVLNVLHLDDDRDELVVLSAVLNSRFLSLFYKERAVKSARLLFPKIVVRNLDEFPYPSKIASKAKVELRDAAVDLAKLVADFRDENISQSARSRAERRAELLERRINQLVYEAFRLTEEEIELIEAAAYDV